MGSAQSYVSLGTALTGLVIAGVVGIGLTRLSSSSTSHVKQNDERSTSAEAAVKKGKTKKQNKGPTGGTTSGITTTEPPPQAPQVVYLSDIMPGQFDANSPHVAQDSSAAENVIPKPKKPKKKKNKNTEDTTKTLSIPSEYHSAPTAPKSRNKRSPQPQTPEVPEASSSRALDTTTTTISLDTDDSWTQVGSRRTRKSSALLRPSGESQSDQASFTTTSQKGDPSPVRNTAEDDSHDSFLLQQSTLPPSSWTVENRTALTEKLSPKPRKTTGEEDLLETLPNRVTPLANEKPVAGFSWADYEDVRVTTDGGENDADGEDDGWGVVTNKRPRRVNISSSTASHSLSFRAPETLTKKQRQNVQKREQQKAAKVEAETQRLTTLAGHKRELEKVRMEFGKAGGSKSTGGGMKASVDERGKLIWE